nr:MAG TPA: hypothetical protein [Crassvirales sp.]
MALAKLIIIQSVLVVLGTTLLLFRVTNPTSDPLLDYLMGDSIYIRWTTVCKGI